MLQAWVTRQGILLVFTLGLWLRVAALQAGDRPVVTKWDFGAEETSQLRSHGGVHRDVPGPRPPDYPDFDAGNTAIKLDGNGAYFAVEDTGAQSPYDFTNGDAITLEAWVQVNQLKAGENVYVIGKGRTATPGFASDNQNWAIRVRETQGKAGVSFLFATPRVEGARPDQHWHRWTTTSGFKPGQGWHHIAVAYRFGDSKTIRCWIDGKAEPGAWDMGGATEMPPVVDNDAVWIGSSNGGAASNSFRGSLDAVAIHRQLLDDATMKARFRWNGTEVVVKPAPEVVPVLDPLPSNKVLVSLHEGLLTHDRWLNEGEVLPQETFRFHTDHVLLDRLPQRYDAWGIRESWQGPVLVRLAADLSLSPGKHQLLLRVRGLSRLWVNGAIVARSKPLTGSPSGEEAMTPVAKPPLPGLRIAEHRQQEVLAEVTIGNDGACRVILETIVGGVALRTDPGELCLALLTDGGKSYSLLQPAASTAPEVPLTDHDVTAALVQLEAALQSLDEQTRRTAAASQNPFWKLRHDLARQWANEHPAPPVPTSAAHPIDAFLAAKRERAVAESAKTPPAEAKQFHGQILPILRDACFRCHGDKENGGLRLHSRDAALKPGDSQVAAIVPGNAAGSELIRRIKSVNPDERMPPGESPLKPEQIELLEGWINAGATWPAPPVSAEDVAVPSVIGDAPFLRRIFLDTVGVPPSEQDLRAFLQDSSPEKRNQVVDRLLADKRWADHWVSYWQDVLAENPTLLNPSLNTTGPFRWYLYEALRDDKPLDRLVTELIMLRGSLHEGGSAGFGIAADNDAPFAAKGQIVANAFLGIELQCARCHDSPYHSTKQKDLYALAAMFERKPVIVPKTSRVPTAFFEKKMRESLIKVTLQPEEQVLPTWPFAETTGSAEDAHLVALVQKADDSRERLAALVTSPRNTRFAQVIVNRVWRRFMGAGLVEPAHDWEGHAASHPDLLQWLSQELITHDYDVKHISRLILTSQTYQRDATGNNLVASPEVRFFVAPERRRMTAEQIIDSLYAASGQPMDVEEITFDPDGRRAANNRITLGVPRRGWMFASLANERDRPSLSLPKAQAITDIMQAFGWSGSRQNPRTDREVSPSVLQPGVLANSTASVWLTRVVEGSTIAELAVSSATPDQLLDSIFLRYLSRLPTDAERAPLAKALAEGFEQRLIAAGEVRSPTAPEVLPRVTWSNHLRSEATTVAMELERRARTGPPADPRFRPQWREVLEDVVWSVVNVPEFVWVP